MRREFTELVAVFQGEGAKGPVAGGREADENFATVIGGGFANDIAAGGEAVDQLDGAVVTDLKTVGEFGDSGELSRGKAFDGEEELVLLGLDSMGAGGFFAVTEKFADLVAEFGERAVGVEGEITGGRHDYIVSRYLFGPCFTPPLLAGLAGFC